MAGYHWKRRILFSSLKCLKRFIMILEKFAIEMTQAYLYMVDYAVVFLCQIYSFDSTEKHKFILEDIDKFIHAETAVKSTKLGLYKTIMLHNSPSMISTRKILCFVFQTTKVGQLPF